MLSDTKKRRKKIEQRLIEIDSKADERDLFEQEWIERSEGFLLLERDLGQLKVEVRLRFWGTYREEWNLGCRITASRMENASVVNADVEWRDEYGIDTEDWMSLSMRATQRKWRVCIESIPRYKYLKLKYETADGVRIKLFMLELEACLYAEPQMGLGNEGEDHELYEDPDVVREAFERQARLQHIASIIDLFICQLIYI
ncbi:hypothetical protein OsJ_01870 [Oryza sativa Japonica Group]|uniref:Uncharacterized protein n=1 Tax=Oryza sativa subsp. japonica TaxID=39947 RepID=A2ZTE4_ORYSJ|nr:hypothetical protein OsJ_01870 [Oryza sativa Japonica Group]